MTTAKDRSTFAAVYCTYDDHLWLDASVESIYSECDAIYFLVSDRPWNGPPSDNQGTLDCIERLPDPAKKIRLVRGSWSNETDQRNHGLALLQEAGYTYCFVVDADEVYDPASLRRMMAVAAEYPQVVCWHMAWNTYWKSMHYCIAPREPYKPVVFVKVGAAHFAQYRAVASENHAIFPPEVGICHHLSYARSDEQLLRKLSTFSHASEILPGWFEQVWKRWDTDQTLTNLHPVVPACWQRAIPVPYWLLPPALRRRYFSSSGAVGSGAAGPSR